MSKHDFQEVIGILVQGKVDYKRIVAGLAVHYPQLFLSIYDGCYEDITFNKDITPAPVPEIRYEERIVEKKVYQEGLPPCVVGTNAKLSYWEEIAVETIKKGRKIHAIWLVRSLTGCGLLEAKKYCDSLQEHFTSMPVSYP